MKESIKTVVIAPDGNEHNLEIVVDGDVAEFLLDGKQVFDGDYSGNFAKIFKRALEIWGPPREEE
ncbi:MAG: hypothetical protein PHH61_06215 [Candidatus Nanoarchaeia archaeon]|jgi:hypothetical protein|nr:hypothetical protein [Candidatus Nanoarchaeia archaeon]